MYVVIPLLVRNTLYCLNIYLHNCLSVVISLHIASEHILSIINITYITVVSQIFEILVIEGNSRQIISIQETYLYIKRFYTFLKDVSFYIAKIDL